MLFIVPLLLLLSASVDACVNLSDYTFELNDGNGTGAYKPNIADDGCDGVSMKSFAGGMAASFRSPRIPIVGGRTYNATFKLLTRSLVPTEGEGSAYLTGGVYFHFFDVNGDSGAWNPQFGTLAPVSTGGKWIQRRATFDAPTTALAADIHLTFAAHTFSYSPNRMLGGRATGEASLSSLTIAEAGTAAILPSTIHVPDDSVLQSAIDQAFHCLHNSKQSGNFTVGAGYTISGNISPDLTFGLYGIRRTGHAPYMDQIRKQWRWHAPNAETGEYTAGRVMGQVNWPLGVDNIFSFTGDEAYLREMLPLVDASLTFVNEHADANGLVTLETNATARIGRGADWVDWYTTRLQGRTFMYHLWLLRCLRRFSEIHREFRDSFGDENLATLYAGRANDLEATLREMYWLEDEGYFVTNPDFPNEGEWLDDSVWSVYHGVADDSMRDTIFRRIDSNVSFFEDIPIRWTAFPTQHGKCSWFGRLGAGDILARFRTGRRDRAFQLLQRISSTIARQGDIYEGYDMNGCGLKKCGCTTSGFGDYLEHCGGIILTVVEGVFGLNFDSTTDYAAEIDPRFPNDWTNASMRTFVRGGALALSYEDGTLSLEYDGNTERGLFVRIGDGCNPHGITHLPANGERMSFECSS
eukprot:g2997.t1